eukprot:jgi/Hompol1/1700/HPOL_005698-RA
MAALRLIAASQAASQATTPDRSVLAYLDNLLLLITERAAADHARYGGVAALPPQMIADLIKCYVRLQDTSAAERLWTFMIDNGIATSTECLNLLLKAYVADGNSAAAMDLVKQCVDNEYAKPDMNSYLHIIDAYANSNSPESSLQVLEHITQVGLPMHINFFNHLISAFSKSGRVDDMNAVRKLMESRMFRPSTVTYNNLIHGYIVAKDFQGAVAVFNEMLQDSKSSFVRSIQCKPDSATFNILIDMYAKQKDAENAATMLNEIIKYGLSPDIISFNTVMDAYRRVGNIERVEEYFALALQTGLYPTEFSYNILIAAHGFSGNVSQATAYFEQMQTKGIAPKRYTFGTLMSIYAQNGDFGASKMLYKQMRTQFNILPSASILSTIMRCGIQAGAPLDQVCEYFDDAAELGLVDDNLCQALLLAHLVRVVIFSDATELQSHTGSGSGSGSGSSSDSTSPDANSAMHFHDAINAVVVAQMAPRGIVPSIKMLEMMLDSILNPQQLLRLHLRLKKQSAQSSGIIAADPSQQPDPAAAMSESSHFEQDETIGQQETTKATDSQQSKPIAAILPPSETGHIRSRDSLALIDVVRQMQARRLSISARHDRRIKQALQVLESVNE